MISLLVALCIIVHPVDHVSRVEIRNHEFAHCNGWEHPDRKPIKGSEKTRYRAFQAPPEYYRKPYPGRVEEWRLPLKKVLETCEGHLGCQWFP